MGKWRNWNLPVTRHKDNHLSNQDLSCGFDEQVNYFSEPIINTLNFEIKISWIYTTIFEIILFLDPVSVNPFLVEDGVKKVTTLFLFLHGLK